MRIAYITETYPPEINGVSLVAAHAVNYLRRVGHTVHLIRPRQPREMAKPAGSDADEWRTAGMALPLRPELRFGWATVAALREHWRQYAPQLVHAATAGPLAWAALRAARAEGITTSADFRPGFDARWHLYGHRGGRGLGWLQPMVLSYLRRLHTMADCSFVPTSSLASELSGRGFKGLRVIGRGVDSNLFSPARRDDDLRDSLGATEEGDRVLLVASRLAAENNVGLALAAFECMRLKHPRLRMVVVGDGPLRRRFQATHPRVCFTGDLHGLELARTYASADVMLCPALTDDTGQTLLGAMASALVVASFNTVAASALIEHGHSGWLAGPGHEAGFFDAARRALLDAAPDGPMRARARAAALRTDWRAQLQAFEQGLRTLVN